MIPRRFRTQIAVLIVGRFVSDFGRGFTMVFFPIYFEKQVGLTTGIIGLGFLGNALFAALAVMVGAYFTDRFGRRRSLLVSMLASAVIQTIYPFVSGPVGYLVISFLSGAALALYWPASSAMITDMSPPESRARLFSVLRVAVNAGLGLGGLGAGLTVKLVSGMTTDPALPYQILFWVDAVTYFAFFLLLLAFVQETLPDAAAASYGGFRSGWAAAARDRRLLALAGLNSCFIVCFSLFLLGFSTFYKQYVGLSDVQVSLVYGLNAAMVVGLQLPSWKLVDRWPRTRALCLAAALFTLGLATLDLCAVDGLSGIGVVVASMIIFTLGELFHGPAITALFADLAPLHLRGTYMSVLSLCWASGLGAGPVISGLVLDAGKPYLLWNGLAAMMLASIVGLLLLGRRLPRDVDRPRPADEVVTPAGSSNQP